MERFLTGGLLAATFLGLALAWRATRASGERHLWKT
jgi:hypothetical protein